MSTQQEIDDIINQSLILGRAIRIGNLQFTASRPMKIGEPSSDVNTIYFTIKKDNKTDKISLVLPRSGLENKYLMYYHHTPMRVNLDDMKMIFRVLVLIGEGLTGEKAELIEDVGISYRQLKK